MVTFGDCDPIRSSIEVIDFINVVKSKFFINKLYTLVILGNLGVKYLHIRLVVSLKDFTYETNRMQKLSV